MPFRYEFKWLSKNPCWLRQIGINNGCQLNLILCNITPADADLLSVGRLIRLWWINHLHFLKVDL